MIYQALNYIVQELNRYLMVRFQLSDTCALLGTVLDEAGTVPEKNQNKIIVSLVNLEHETNHPYALTQQYSDKGNITQNLPYNFNLDILLLALFSNYDEALKFLSESIYFFQSKQVFTHQNAPGLDPAIEKLSLEIIKLSYHEMHSLWTALGAKYLPSVLFKTRMLSFQSGDIDSIVPVINTVAPSVNPSA